MTSAEHPKTMKMAEGPNELLELLLSDPDEITEWIDWSEIHILSAAHFAHEATRLQEIRKEMTDDDLTIAMHAVFGSVAFLEATINELFLGALRQPSVPPLARQLNVDHTTALVTAWKTPQTNAYSRQSEATKSKPTLLKFQDALVLTGRQPFDENASPYEDVRVLLDLRNDLIHYKPKWKKTFSTSRPNEVVAPKLKGRFPLSPLPSRRKLGESLEGYIGYGLASWAVNSSFALSEAFHHRMGLKPVYDYEYARNRIRID